MSSRASDGSRLHIVLVPGFGGFDALGRLHYYAGVTPVFRSWQAEEPDDPRRARAVLHYFDNLPTAAVSTRAERLRRYLARRVVRNEIQRGDTVALVGHSTGGLDIRWMLWTLLADPDAVKWLDGNNENAVPVRNDDVRGRVKRVVFLSVPQRGTNIADWLSAYEMPRRFLAEALSDAVHDSGRRRDRTLGEWLTRSLAEWVDADLFRAAQDVLIETDAARFAPDSMDAVEAREAYMRLWLWSSGIAADFNALSDLMCARPSGDLRSPVHLSDEQRRWERSVWKERGIATRSYATVSRCPFERRVLDERQPWVWWDLRTFPEVGLVPDAREWSDVFYRFCYRACLSGPFMLADGPGVATMFGTGEKRRVDVWENDGIVNTASMLSPGEDDTLLVECDHGDIIGHYKLARMPPDDQHRAGAAAKPHCGRRYHTYDLLRSGSTFGDEEFRKVWRDIFDFCVSDSGTSA
ncbi:hypothetical protein WMF31_05510 [Sorangium sp. So ce1036]|uniref:esterase/lipase family protein n=1 Tax=Sorangium sp. So ce1036 TaxID=3133328 RepID=UPI003F03887F